MPEDQPLFELLLDQEEPLRDLLDMVIALDLIASGGFGIAEDDMCGLKIVARGARGLAKTVRQNWRDILERSRQARADSLTP